MCAINVLCILENISFLTLGTNGGKVKSLDMHITSEFRDVCKYHFYMEGLVL